MQWVKSKQWLSPHLTTNTPPAPLPHFSTRLRTEPFKLTKHKAPPKTNTILHNTTLNQSNYPYPITVSIKITNILMRCAHVIR